MSRHRLIWVGLTKRQLIEVSNLLHDHATTCAWPKTSRKRAAIYALKFYRAKMAFER